MSDFVFVIDEEASASASTGGGSKFGTMETGVYDVTIGTASISKTKNGNNVMDLSIKTDDGHETTIYQAFMMDAKWSSGADNYGYATWQAFITTTQMKGMSVFQKPLVKEDGTAISKNGQPIVLSAIKELEGKKVKLAIVKVFDMNKGEPTEGNEVFASFTTDGASSKEVLSGSASGVVLEKLSTRLSDKKTKTYKAWEADAGDELPADLPEAGTEDLGL